MSKTLLVVYHSQSGASAALARAACGGAQRERGIQVRLLRAVDAGVRELAAADALLLVCAENSGALAGAVKDFLDRIFYPANERRLVLPYALLISAGNDGRGAREQARRILSGIPFTAAAEPLILRGAPGPAELDKAAELGQGLAAGLEMGIF